MDVYIEVDTSDNTVSVTAEAHESFDYASWTIEYLVEEFLGDYNDDEGVRSAPLSQNEINELHLVASRLRAGAEEIFKFIQKNQGV